MMLFISYPQEQIIVKKDVSDPVRPKTSDVYKETEDFFCFEIWIPWENKTESAPII